MSEDQIGVPEVWRGVQAIRADIAQLSADVALRPDWQDLKRSEDAIYARIEAEVTVRQLERHTADKAIKALEDWQSWAIRIVLGSIGTGILGWIITQGLGA